MGLSSLIFSIFFSILFLDADRVIPDGGFRTAVRVQNPSIRTQQQAEVVMPPLIILGLSALAIVQLIVIPLAQVVKGWIFL